MPLANCPQCHRLFNQMGAEVCPNCREEEDQAYASIYSYLSANPQADLEQVVNASGVSAETIRGFIKSGRLVGFENLAMSVLSCQRCGTAISIGRYCQPCRQELSKSLAKPFGA